MWRRCKMIYTRFTPDLHLIIERSTGVPQCRGWAERSLAASQVAFGQDVHCRIGVAVGTTGMFGSV